MKIVFKFVNTAEFEEVCAEIRSMLELLDMETFKEGLFLFSTIVSVYFSLIILLGA